MVRLILLSCQIMLATCLCRFSRTAAAETVSPDRPGAGKEGVSLRSVAPGVFALGEVRLSKKERNISFPAFINMRDGTIEYGVVHKSGKTHESVLRTHVQPQDVHMAMLFLDAKPASTNVLPPDASTPLPGQRVTLEVAWKTDRGEVRHRMEELIVNKETQRPLAKGEWVYNGSHFAEGAFLAQRDGSVISVISDAGALINNPRPGRENDDLWTANTKLLPPLESAVTVVISLK